MAILGNNIIVLMGGTAIAGTKSDELQVDCETIEIASATDQGWTHYLAGRKSWSLTVGFLLLAQSDIRNVLNNGSNVTLIIKGRNDNSNTLTGNAIMRTQKLTFTQGNLAQGSIQFIGNGPLT